MPKAGGLDDVTQRFDADNTGYIKASEENVVAAEKMAKANRDALKSFDDLRDVMRSSGDIGTAKDALNSYLGEMQRVKEMQKELGIESQNTAKQSGDAAVVALGIIKAQQQAQEEFFRKTSDMRAAIAQAEIVSLSETKAAHQEFYAKVAQMRQDIAAAEIISISETKAAYAAARDEQIAKEQALQKEIERTAETTLKMQKQIRTGSAMQAWDNKIGRVGGGMGASETLLTQLQSGIDQVAANVNDYVNRNYSFADAFANAVAARFSRGKGTSAAGVAEAVAAAGGGSQDVLAESRRLQAAVFANPSDPVALKAFKDFMGQSVVDAVGGGFTRVASDLGGGGGLSQSIQKGMAADAESRKYQAFAGGGEIIQRLIEATAAGAATYAAVMLATNARGVAVGGARAAGGLLDAGIAGAAALTGGGQFGMGAAATHWGVVAGALGTWLPRIHYAMMAFNELASIVGPAVIAGGAAVAVGYQGGQLAVTRYQAMQTVQEALGKSLHQTAAGFAGVKSNMQAAQNAANTGVWELAGAGINSMTGKTQIFTQMGTNTIAMLDTFAAKATLAFTHGVGANVMQQVADQGTHYLQQFGQVVGNIGTTFLHVAPNLPGIGGDLLSTLQGATKAASWASGALPGGLLGTLLAGEAGARYGPTVVGAGAAGLEKIGLGTVAHAATAEEIAAAAKVGKVINAGEIVAGTGAAGALGAASVPVLATLAGAAYLIGRTATAQSPQQQKLAQLQSGIDQSIVGGSGINNIISAMQQVGPTGGPQTMMYGTSVAKAYKDVFSSHFFKGLQEVFQTGWGSIPGAVGTTRAGGFGGSGFGTGVAGDLPTAANLNKQALAKMAGSFNNTLMAGSQVAKMMGVGLPDAFGLTQQALLQVGTAFKSNGQLTDAAKQQILNLEAGYHAMNSTAGVFGKNIGAVNTAMGLQNTQVGNVNTAWDQFTNNAVTGAVGASSFAKNLQVAHPALKAMQGQLSGFGAGSAAAWATFASPSTTTPGLLQQAQSQADWIRIAQTSGALGAGQGAGMTAYLAQQLLPYGAKSPLAASAIGILGQQAGMPSGLDQKQQTAWLDKHTMSQKDYNKAIAQAGVTMSSVSGQAAHFGQTVQSNVVNAMAQGAVNLPKMTTDMSKLAGTFTSGGGFNTGALKTVAGDLKNIGLNAQSAGAIITNAMSAHGIDTSKMTAAMNAVKQAFASVPASKTVKLTATADASQVQSLKSQMDQLHDKLVHARAIGDASQVAAINAQIAALHDKTVQVTTTILTNYITTHTNAAPVPVLAGPSGQVYQAHTLSVQGNQAGWRVPGWGGGDIWPAMLEPGEAVVPKHLVASIAPYLAAHNVPGFASGRIPNAMWVPPSDGPGNPNWVPGGNLPIPAAAQKVLDQLLAELSKSGAWKQVGVSIIDGISYSLSGTGKDANKVGQALVQQAASAAAGIGHKIQAEFNYARGVAGAALYGQGYDPTGKGSGIFGGMNVTPGTGNGTVMEQMQTYLDSVKSFSGDLKNLSKQGLSKAIMQQLVAAGPVQGDALAQSILNDYGGVKGVNSVWNQLGQASKGLGANAAMAQYGGIIAPDLKSGTFTSNNISITVNAPGGGTGNLPLTTSQINAIVREIEAKLLQQARRNRKTGVQARGKGA